MEHNFFEVVFPDVVFDYSGDTQVCCPFPHKVNGVEHFETNPSAGINLAKGGVFHCFSCNRAFSEIGFIAEYLNTSYTNASEIQKIIASSEDLEEWKYAVTNLWNNNAPMETLFKLGITKQAAQDLQLGYKGQGIIFPIIMFGRLLDEVLYRPGETPKYIRKSGSTSGLIFGYDLWKNNHKNTIICAGEKDCTIARSKGFNAISFTGGELAVPHLFLNEFKGRKVYITYDNDDTGRRGASELALNLQPIAEEVHVVDISTVCVEKGGDLWDYFQKYNKTPQQFLELLKATPIFTEEDRVREKNKLYPIISLHEATTEKFIGKVLRSNIQVIASMDNTFVMPTLLSSHKYKTSQDKDRNLLSIGHKTIWSLNERNLKEMFYMIDSGLREKAIESHIRTELLRIPPKEDYVSVKHEGKKSVYKCVVSDITSATDSTPLTEFVCYSIDNRLEAGKKYLITYKLVPHPQDGQKLMMVVNDVEDSDDFLNNFKIDNAKIELLKKFQPEEGTSPKEKFNDTIQRIKGIVNADYNDLLLTIIDITYHSAFQFSVGKFADIKGCLDTLVVAESRIGKSSTAEALQATYGVSKFISLAGSSATVAGIIGGSNKVGGGYQTRAGIIPQNHKGLIVFEELAKCRSEIIKELTDLRSSGKARITRVNGSIELPAMARMLTLTNAKSMGDMPKPITSYPNGISVLLDLVGTAEDIARYDMIAIFGFDADKPIDPFFEPLEPYSKEEYQTRIRWIWSRTQEQIIITKEIYEYTIKRSNALNAKYNSYIKIFGIEAWKKILRVAIAVAGYLVSTDETYENIVVKNAHVDIAIDLLVSLYDNPTFRFKEFVEEERKLKEIDKDGIQRLQELYEKNPTLLMHLVNSSSTNRTNLSTLSGMDNESFGKMMHELVANLFVQIEGFSITPTERFRRGMSKINLDVKVRKVGEVVISFDKT